VLAIFSRFKPNFTLLTLVTDPSTQFHENSSSGSRVVQYERRTERHVGKLIFACRNFANALKDDCKARIKVKLFLEQAAKAQKGSRGVALLCL
jgi:hypothetical protein